MADLGKRRNKEARVHDQQRHENIGGVNHGRAAPRRIKHEGEDTVGQHCRRHRDAVSARQRLRIVERDDQQDDKRHHRPVHARHVNLPVGRLGRVENIHAGEEAEVDGLTRDRKCARDHRLRRDNRGAGRKNDHGQESPARDHEIERVLKCPRVPDHKSALPEIVQREAWIDKARPR